MYNLKVTKWNFIDAGTLAVDVHKYEHPEFLIKGKVYLRVYLLTAPSERKHEMN